jgi:hypothetical protein
VLEHDEMNNLINCGGTRRFSDAYASKSHSVRHAGRWNATLRFASVLLLVALAAPVSNARDPEGRYAAQNPELHKWFESLRSAKGPCCSDADGTAVADVDWETSNGHYRVRLDGEWIEVPDEAVITEPNRIGRTMVWPIRDYPGISIRCFMPGSMT